MKSQKPILLVEDDLVDIMTIKRALKDIHVSNEIVSARNGEEALTYLQNQDNESPCLVLLDLNMPRMNGLEFLREARTHHLLTTSPVIILTTSREEMDRMESFRLYAAGYMVKPVDYLQFVEVVRTIHDYWTLSELPN